MQDKGLYRISAKIRFNYRLRAKPDPEQTNHNPHESTIVVGFYTDRNFGSIQNAALGLLWLIKGLLG